MTNTRAADPRIAISQHIIEQGILADTHDTCNDCLAALRHNGTIREAQPCYYMLDGVLGKCARCTRHGRTCYVHNHNDKTDGLRTRPVKNIFAVYRSDEELATARSRLEAYNIKHDIKRNTVQTTPAIPTIPTFSIVPATVASTPTTIPTPATIPTIATSTIKELRIACQKLADVREVVTNSEEVPLSFAAQLAEFELKLESYAFSSRDLTRSHNPVEVVSSNIAPVNS
ncbi:hypothetical protein TREMEDRAFT_62136 [Tremella mesenterica DSM 1558]|uniref:uncharacterized protein n=1 Tax=Tremella mesenterica (strain ATCC 24925 / CBS 8224 / DSM 1558 / NBRC 9311 / NRRL Y-6157 / RJB 2259-6 / UBC 559-6) TaxID=578456 RepID=UPI0003F4926B|nr:uncharacterized protein TREMEDRAFT_62136 [Tremella mesenterica DSM 1558]EIW69278.1 hypothetical protein TREMEDRAFT_62136 [Tremella mesenterica DSM 1558]